MNDARREWLSLKKAAAKPRIEPYLPAGRELTDEQVIYHHWRNLEADKIDQTKDLYDSKVYEKIREVKFQAWRESLPHEEIEKILKKHHEDRNNHNLRGLIRLDADKKAEKKRKRALLTQRKKDDENAQSANASDWLNPPPVNTGIEQDVDMVEEPDLDKEYCVLIGGKKAHFPGKKFPYLAQAIKRKEAKKRMIACQKSWEESDEDVEDENPKNMDETEKEHTEEDAGSQHVLDLDEEDAELTPTRGSDSGDEDFDPRQLVDEIAGGLEPKYECLGENWRNDILRRLVDAKITAVDLESAKAEIKKMKAKNDKLQEQMDESAEVQEAMQADLERLNTQVMEATKIISVRDDTISEQKKAYDKLLDEKKTITTERNQLAESLNVAKAKISAKNETIKKLQGYNEAFENECKKSQDNRQKLEAWGHQIMNEKATIAAELAQVTAENVNLREHIRLLTEQSPTVAMSTGGAVFLKKQEEDDHDREPDPLQ